MAAGEGFSRGLKNSPPDCFLRLKPPPCSNPSPQTRLPTKKHRPCWDGAFLLAAGEGFEPSQTESESGVLPLHKPAICFKHILLYAPFTICQDVFCFLAHFFWQRKRIALRAAKLVQITAFLAWSLCIPQSGTGSCPRSVSAQWRSQASFP